ncbi:MAG: hypothetical protein AB1650_06305 [Candidatus Omnitrophota bacterium]
MKNFLKNNQHGALLLETLIAVMILAVGLVGIVGSFIVSLKADRESRNYLTAVILLENKLTEILSYRYLRPEIQGEGAFDDPYAGFHYKVTAEAAGPADILERVNVTVRWGETGSERVLEAATMMFIAPEDFPETI